MRDFIRSLCSVTAATVMVVAADAQPSRLAILLEDERAAPASDLLTVELSHHEQIELLERTQINKVRKEQGLSASRGGEDLKLGELLGADGVLVLSLIERGSKSYLNVRLAAVKPGVVLDIVEYELQRADTAQWAKLVARRFEPQFPKLGVLSKDAIPISMLGLRFAVKTTKGEQFERELNLLLQHRLINQNEVFVLERQKLQDLAEEKDLKGLGEAPFWNGSYLLEGTIDKEGFQKETVTISVRLSPPGNRSPLEFEVKGNPREPKALVEQLAARILLALNRKTSSHEWQPNDEANRYFEEAMWALRWGMFYEAQAAADSSWVLGRRDMDCALARMKACTRLVWGQPDPKSIDSSVHMLEMYSELSRTFPPEEQPVASEWYQAGVGSLVTASSVLMHSWATPQSQRATVDKLRELRGLARSTAAWLSRSPSVPATYRQGERRGASTEDPTILGCELHYGCFWQERPERGIALYRELMASDQFPKLFQGLCFRENLCPRLVAWNAADEKRIPLLWSSFLTELNASTNLAGRLQAKMLEVVDAGNDPEREAACDRLFTLVSAHYETMVTNSDVKPYWWQWNRLLPEATFSARLAAMQSEYEQRLRREFLIGNSPLEFARFSHLFYGLQLSPDQAVELLPLLADYKTNFDTPTPKLDLAAGLSPEKAIATLTHAQAKLSAIGKPGDSKAASGEARSIRNPTNETTLGSSAVSRVPGQSAESATNVLLVSRFIRIPPQTLAVKWPSPRPDLVSWPFSYSHRLYQDRLWLDVRYGLGSAGAAAAWDSRSQTWEIIPYPVEGDPAYSRSAELRVSETEGGLYIQPFEDALYASEWLGPMKKYVFKSHHWENLPIPIESPTQLFAVGDHLYAASSDFVFEVLDGGQRTRVLASCRRRPPVSLLDTRSSLGPVALFPGPGNSLRASVGDKIFTWDGRDWTDTISLPNVKMPPEDFEDGTIFKLTSYFEDRTNGKRKFINPAKLWFLPHEQSQAEFCLSIEARETLGALAKEVSRVTEVRFELPRPTWPHVPGLFLGEAAVTSGGSNLYCLSPHIHQDPLDRVGIAAEERRRSDLICLDHDFPLPLVIPLKFVSDPDYPPDAGWNDLLRDFSGPPLAAWILFTSDFLVIGHARQLGFWAIPRLQIDGALAALREKQRALMAAATPRKKKDRATLLARYDSNHDGVLDRSEMFAIDQDLAYMRQWEANLPDRLETIVDRFDMNRDGRLELAELGRLRLAVITYAGTVTDPEWAGTTARLLAPLLSRRFPPAPALIEKYDVNKDGGLDAGELTAFAYDLHKNP